MRVDTLYLTEEIHDDTCLTAIGCEMHRCSPMGVRSIDIGLVINKNLQIEEQVACWQALTDVKTASNQQHNFPGKH